MTQVEQTEAYHYLVFNGIFSEEAIDALDLIKNEDLSQLSDSLIDQLNSYIKASQVHSENDDHIYDPYDINPFKDTKKVSIDDIMKCTTSTSISNNSVNCTICMSEPHDPVSVVCGHVYCKQCITQWITSCKATCPLCNATISV